VAAKDGFEKKLEGTITLGEEGPNKLKLGPEEKGSGSYCSGIKQVCSEALDKEDGYEHLYWICRYFDQVGFLESNTIGNPNKSYTVFLATNEGVDRLWYDQYGYEPGDKIPKEFVKQILLNNIVKENYLEPEDIICRDRIPTHHPGSSKPTVVCKDDILGGMAAFVKGKGNTAKIYLPRFINPSDNWECSKDIGYEMNNVILYDKP